MTVNVVTPVFSGSVRRTRPYADDGERALHLAEIAAIAHDHAWPIAEVASCYERILGDLKQRARVQDYLHVFVAKKVAAALTQLHRC